MLLLMCEGETMENIEQKNVEVETVQIPEKPKPSAWRFIIPVSIVALAIGLILGSGFTSLLIPISSSYPEHN